MKILVADALAEAGVAALSEHHEVDVKTGLSKAELLLVVPGYHAIVVRSATTIDADIIAAATDLRVVARAGVGLDNVDVDAATRAGVIVCNAPQSNVVSAAEHTMGMLLAVARNIPQAHAALMEGRWERSSWKGTELTGKTLGVLGLGRIGTLVATRAAAFGMSILAYDPYITHERANRIGATLAATVDEVTEQADFVTIHLPRNADTVNLINADRLSRMKPTARIINVARGGIVNEAELAQALADGVIAGAAIDVFDSEPTTESPLFAQRTVVVTPHLGASTEEAQDKAGTQVADAVRLALAGEFVPSAVNVQGGAVDDEVKPYLSVGEKLGRLLTSLTVAPVGEVTVEYTGDIAGFDCRVVGLSVLKGLLGPVVHEPVTFVNAPLLAEDRGIRLTEVSSTHSSDYVSVLRVVGTMESGEKVSVAGTVLGPNSRERLVEVWSAEVDLEPSSHMAFFRYADRPGVMGAIGTAFGTAGVNIVSAQVGPLSEGEALMALTLDEAVSRERLDAIATEIGATAARAIEL